MYPVFVNSPRLCQIVSISRSMFYRLLDQGLPTIGAGRRRRHDLDAVLKWYGSA